MANEMQYRFSESAFVGPASNGTVVRVDESEMAEAIADALREGHGIILAEIGDWNTADPAAVAAYDAERDRLLDADEWVELIGINPNVEADE